MDAVAASFAWEALRLALVPLTFVVVLAVVLRPARAPRYRNLLPHTALVAAALGWLGLLAPDDPSGIGFLAFVFLACALAPAAAAVGVFLVPSRGRKWLALGALAAASAAPVAAFAFLASCGDGCFS